MKTDNPSDSIRHQESLRWRYVFTRMVPTAVIVFFVLFSFYPNLGNPLANLTNLKGLEKTSPSQQQLKQAADLRLGLESLQASGELGAYLQTQSGSTDGQTLMWNEQERILSISGGNRVELSSLVGGAGSPQALSKTGNSLVISGSPTVVDLGSYLDNTDAQALSLQAMVLTISGGNSIDLAPINTDSQSVSLVGTDLTITGGNTISLASINTDVLAGLNCSAGQVAQWNGSAWICASPAASSDSQTLSLAANNLSILNGNTVSLAGYLDNTDAQSLSLGGNTLSLVNGGSVNLGLFLDNTDILASLGCSANQIAKWNGSAWACAADVDTVLNEAQVDAYTTNNGYLTTEVDGSTTNEFQTLNWNSGTRILTISSTNTVDLTSLLDNTDTQAISRTGDTLNITGNASTVDLSSYLDNTDAQTVGLAGSTLTISGGNSINLAPINTDNQNLSLTGTTLNISGGTGVDIASINTDVLATLGCAANQIAKWSGSAWACSADNDTTTNEAQVDAWVANNGYLTAEVDGSTSNEIQSLSLAANVLSISGSNSVSLAGYLDNTDSQNLSYNTGTHVISISGGNAQDLSNLLDNTDSQAISKTGNTLNITGNASTVDLSSYLDNTDTLASLSCTNGQIAQWNGSAWACANSGVDTDQQTLSLAANSLSISNGNAVSLAGYLDNTDAQAISRAGNVLSISGNAGTVDLAPYLDNTDAQSLSLGGNTLSLVNGGSVNLAAYLDNTDVLANLACGSGQIAKWNGSAWACAADNDTVANETQVDAWVSNNGYLTSEVDGSTSNEIQTLSWDGGTQILTISSGNTANLGSLLDNTDAQIISRTGNTISITGSAGTVDLAPYLDNTDAQAISRAGNTLSISGNAGTVDLASYLDNTDAQTLSLGGTTLTVTGGNSIDLAPINTDSQNLSLAGTTLNISGGTGVDIASINTDVLASLSCSLNQIAKWNGSAWACAADNDTDTDSQTISIASNNLSILNGNSVDLSPYLDNTDSQAISRVGNTISISGSVSTVDLALYLDNTDVLASLSCGPNQIAKWNGSAWACAADNDTIIGEATIESYIFDGDNIGTITSGTFDLNSLTFTGELTDANIAGALTISGTGSVADAALSSNVTKLGQTIETGEITDGTIAAADIAPDSLDFTELSDALSLDATTAISLGANDLAIDLDATGEFIIRDAGTISFEVSNTGNVYVGDTGSAIATGAALVLDSITAEGNVLATNGAIYYNSFLSKFRCYEGGAWKDCISAPASENDIASTYRFFVDFVGNSTTLSPDVYATNSGTGAASSAIATTAANRPGMYRSTTGTTATGRSALSSGLTAFALGSGATAYETAINVTTLSDAANRYQLVVGMFDTATAANQVDAVAFVYDEGGVSAGSVATPNWQIMTSSNSTRTFNTTTTAVAAATWYKLRVEINAAGTLATYYINGANVGTRNTNIPVGTARALGFGHLVIKSIGTTARTVDVDYMKAEQDFTTAR